MTLSTSHSGNPEYTSGTVLFSETSYFECAENRQLYFKLYDSNGDLRTTLWLNSLACQAINMFTLEPRVYGSSEYDIDMDMGWTLVSPGKCRYMLLNTGWDGQVYWEIQHNASSPWVSPASGYQVKTGFDISMYTDMDCDRGDQVMRRRTLSSPGSSSHVIATSTGITTSLSQEQTQIHLNLIGTAGSNTLQVVRSCNVPGSNCNSCPVPTVAPTQHPTLHPTTAAPTPPTLSPTMAPTDSPTPPTPHPTLSPTWPTVAPTLYPTTTPTLHPTEAPSTAPTSYAPSFSPSYAPTIDDSTVLDQSVTYDTLASPDTYSGTVKQCIEAGYAYSIGISDSVRPSTIPNIK